MAEFLTRTPGFKKELVDTGEIQLFQRVIGVCSQGVEGVEREEQPCGSSEGGAQCILMAPTMEGTLLSCSEPPIPLQCSQAELCKVGARRAGCTRQAAPR